MSQLKFIDLFCGIGGFHHAMDIAAEKLKIDAQCVFASDIDAKCRDSYEHNFEFLPHGDITQISEKTIPKHDILLGGFPCQAFSIIGDMKGFEDTRGTLFFDIARILKQQKPSGFVLENVKQLVGHDKGRTISTILKTCNDLGYDVKFKVLNALDFGLPQKRERVFIVGWKGSLNFDFESVHKKIRKKSLKSILVKNVDEKYYASDYIKNKRFASVKPHQIQHGRPTIWHENKSGNISAYEYSCALRAGASHNYLLVDGERRLTEREMLRLQGFPNNHAIVGTYSEVRRQAGNALPVPMASEVIYELLSNNFIGSGSSGNSKTSKGISSKTPLPA